MSFKRIQRKDSIFLTDKFNKCNLKIKSINILS
jgi:hypothetical protein